LSNFAERNAKIKEKQTKRNCESVKIENLEQGDTVESSLTSDLLSWYDEKKRSLPWRGSVDPYHIWISEIILQQTRVDQGTGYFLKFIERFPCIERLAVASEQEVLAVWQGLGYYSRALNVHRAAKIIVEERQGCFPETATEWKKLPGVGDYTASAVASIAFGDPQAAVDGNVLRVISRLTCENGSISDTLVRKRITSRAQSMLSPNRPGDFNQAMMELGALVCTPKRPKCDECPIVQYCRSYLRDQVHMYPVVIKKKPPKEVNMWYLVYFNRKGIFLRRRGSGSIWQQLWEFLPVSEENYRSTRQGKCQVPQSQVIPELERMLEHRLTHRTLRISFLPLHCSVGFTDDSLTFVVLNELKNYPLPVVFSKYLNEMGLWEGLIK